MTRRIEQKKKKKKNPRLQTSDVLVCTHTYFVSKWKYPQGANLFPFVLLSTLSLLLIR